MNSFELYFRLGLEHILKMDGYASILFILALCAVFVPRDWRKVVVLVAIFTISLSVSLALATYKVVQVNSSLIAFLIPVTIAITALNTVLRPRPTLSKGISLNHFFAIFFGLIHGFGFSAYLRGILSEVTWKPLLAFNLGLTLGQLLVASIFLILTSILVGIAGVNRKEWTLVVSSMVLGVALMMMLETKIW